jgi:hypothetical protein
MFIQTTFLLRLFNDPQSGSILFTTNGTQNSKIVFTIDPGLLDSVLVQNAAQTSLDGQYNYITLLEGKPYYTKGSEGYYYIIWINNRWNIFDFSEESDAIYYSNEDVFYPWLVSTWTSLSPQYNPPPTVTRL